MWEYTSPSQGEGNFQDICIKIEILHALNRHCGAEDWLPGGCPWGSGTVCEWAKPTSLPRITGMAGGFNKQSWSRGRGLSLSPAAFRKAVQSPCSQKSPVFEVNLQLKFCL